MNNIKAKVVVWKDGIYKYIEDGVTWEYEHDIDFLVAIEIDKGEILEMKIKELEDFEKKI